MDSKLSALLQESGRRAALANSSEVKSPVNRGESLNQTTNTQDLVKETL